MLLLLSVLAFVSLVASQVNKPNPQMYEISTRPWLYLLSQKYGKTISKLSDIPDAEFLALKQKGIDVVWMMGVWSLGAYGLNFDRTDPGLLQSYNQVLPGWTQADVIGSPYAVKDYTCNPQLGSDADIIELKSRLNAMGLKLMLDFVPNHSAVDALLAISNPEFFVHSASKNPPYDPTRYQSNGVAYGWDGYGGSWMDTSQFNYWNLNFRRFQIMTLLKIAFLADYIRCDMAYLALNDMISQTWGQQMAAWGYARPPTEFWTDAIAAVKAQYPNVQFLAEVYDPWPATLQSVGFDYTYDKQLYNRLQAGNMDSIRAYIKSLSLTYQQKSARYVENHDELRSPVAFGGNSRADAATMISMTLPGMKFYFMGQEHGYSNKLDVHLLRATAENPAPGVDSFYTKLFGILASNAFHLGSWTYLDVINSNDAWTLVAWKWSYGDQKILCVINYSTQKGSGAVILSDATPRNGNDNIPVTDLLTGITYTRSARQMQTQGLFVVLDSYSGQFLSY